MIYWAKDGFDIRRIGHCVEKSVSLEKLDPEILHILNQRFFYLARGRQSFAFESEDGKYVLKLPRTDRYKTKLWIRSLPFFKERAAQSFKHKQMRSAFVFNSFEIADQELKEETGILYLHLKKTEGLPSITIRNRVKENFKIQLDETVFLLQKKIPMGFPLLFSLIEKNETDQAKKMIDQFLDLCIARAKKGVFNRDSNFLMNFAYDGEKFVQIDVGSFHHKPEYPHQLATFASYKEATTQLQLWLDEIDPELKNWLNQRIQERECDL